MRFPVVLLLSAIAVLTPTAPAAAQGVSSVLRPAGTDFSVTTGIGTSSTLTSHPPLQFPPATRAVPIIGLFPYVPDEKQGKGQNEEDREHGEPAAAPRHAPSPYQESNTIARDRIESPHDSAFNEHNVFREK